MQKSFVRWTTGARNRFQPASHFNDPHLCGTKSLYLDLLSHPNLPLLLLLLPTQHLNAMNRLRSPMEQKIMIESTMVCYCCRWWWRQPGRECWYSIKFFAFCMARPKARVQARGAFSIIITHQFALHLSRSEWIPSQASSIVGRRKRRSIGSTVRLLRSSTSPVWPYWAIFVPLNAAQKVVGYF